MTDSDGNSTNGYGAIVSAITALVVLLSAVHPDWLKLVALSNHLGELKQVLETALGGLSIVGASISHPPAWLREPWDDLKCWILSHFRRKVQP